MDDLKNELLANFQKIEKVTISNHYDDINYTSTVDGTRYLGTAQLFPLNHRDMSHFFYFSSPLHHCTAFSANIFAPSH